MNAKVKAVIKGALVAAVVCGFLPIWQYWAYSSWEVSQRFGILPLALLSFLIAIREEGFLRAFFHFYFITFITLIFVCSVGGAIGFFRLRSRHARR